MKYNLLELTQTVLSSMDGDDVASISDTPEAGQVATVIRTVYMDMLSRANLPEHYSFVNLTASGDAAQPVMMTIPTDVDEVFWVKYDKQILDATDVLMQPVYFKPIEEFLQQSYLLNESDTTVDSMTLDLSSTITVLFRNDKAPDFYTTYDDNTLLFDSYDNEVDTTGLQSEKTMAYVKTIIPFTMSDTFTPDLDEPQFALLLNEAKALAWAELRQLSHTKAEVNAKRGWTRLQKTKFTTEHTAPLDQTPNYGRK